MPIVLPRGPSGDTAAASTGHEKSPRRQPMKIAMHSPGLERECGDLLVAHGYRVLVVPQRRRLRQNRPAPHNRWLVASHRGP